MPRVNVPYFITGEKDVTAAGTPENLPEIKLIAEGCAVLIKSKAANTGAILVSYNDGTAATATTATPFRLDHAKDMLKLWVKNTSSIELDAAVNGDGVEYVVELVQQV